LKINATPRFLGKTKALNFSIYFKLQTIKLLLSS